MTLQCANLRDPHFGRLVRPVCGSELLYRLHGAYNSMARVYSDTWRNFDTTRDHNLEIPFEACPFFKFPDTK
jgi:hypothetical protein